MILENLNIYELHRRDSEHVLSQTFDVEDSTEQKIVLLLALFNGSM